ncbi:hypothetical protein NUACC21_73860 [Scytonema sp. NUACC21]
MSTSGNSLIDGLGGLAGFGENILDRNDDSSTGFIDITSVFDVGLNFFGTVYNGFYINNNGNITFNAPSNTYTPFAITGNTGIPIIAPFFTDIDTRADAVTSSVGGNSTGSNLVYWDLDPANNTVTITWDDVGQFSYGTTPNAFQLRLRDTGGGNFTIEFRYEDIQWYGGNARAGFSAANGTNFFELSDSGTDKMLDLESASNTNQAGIFLFSVVNGNPNQPPTDISLSYSTVHENSPNGTFIGTLTTTDPDAEQLYTYTLLDDAGGRFAIDGKQLIVANQAKLNYETSSSHNIIVRTTDIGGLTHDESITITINNVPEADLSITATAPLTAYLGETIQVSWTVTNQGDGAVVPTSLDLGDGVVQLDNWVDSVYLSDDTELDLDGSDRDTLLTTRTIKLQTPLAANGGTYDQQLVDIIIPETAITGSKYLLFVTDRDNNQYEDNKTNNVQARAIAITAPDLQVESLDIVSSNVLGSPITLNWTVRNTGDGTATRNWRDRFYLSTDGTISDDDIVIWTEDIINTTPFAKNTTYSKSATTTLPLNPDLSEGTYYILLETDANKEQLETSDSNNKVSASRDLTLPLLPDLVVSNITSPPTEFSGQRIQVSWTLHNQGNGVASGTWSEQIYLSNDAVIGNEDDELINTFEFTGTMVAGQLVTRIQEITLPVDWSGERWIVVKTDTDQKVYEHNKESNNTGISAQPINIHLSPFPNLRVSSVTAPLTAFSSQKTVIEWTVTNTGTGSTSAPIWYDAIWLSLDDKFDSSDIYLGKVENTNYLNVNESYTNSLTVTLPETVNGNYHFLVKTDYNAQVQELQNEGDNFGVSNSSSIKLTPQPDLQPTVVNSPSQAFSGQRMTLNWTVTNNGPGSTSKYSWYDTVYMSVDDELDIGDRYLGMRYHYGDLGVNESYRASLDVTLPTGVSGNFYFLVKTDASDSIHELALEANNVAYQPTPTTVNLTPPPDLEVELVEAPVAAVASHPLTINYRVVNNGATATPNYTWIDAIYLSADTQFEPSTDIFLDNVTHYGNLEAGGFYHGSVTSTLPDGLSGTFHVFVVTDKPNDVFELNNGNNVGSSVGLVTVSSHPADLVVSAIDVQPSVEAGKATRISWAVTNIGTGDTAVRAWTDKIFASTDTTLGNSDDVLLHYSNHYGVLNPGEFYSLDELVTIPFNLSGQYNLFVVTDTNDQVYEATAISNNYKSQLITVNRDTPDLQVTGVSVINATPSVSSTDKLTVNWTVKNFGNGRTNAYSWYDSVYLSTDIQLNSQQDIYLGQVFHSGALDQFGSYDGSGTFDLPIDLKGNYYVIVHTDKSANGNYNDQVLEGSLEDNNDKATSNTTVITQGEVPNLVVESVDAPINAISGQQFNLTWTVRNEGAATGYKRWYDAIYLSRDQIFDRSSDIYLDYQDHVGGLAAGESYTKNQLFKVPQGLSGSFYVFVATDGGNQIYERSGEGNNVKYDTNYMRVNLPAPADLTVGTITIPTNAVPGLDATISYTINNIGPNAAQGIWYDSIYISADDKWDINDTFFGRIQAPVSYAAVGESYESAITAPLPGVVPGDYHVIVKSDIRNAIVENNENNNIGGSLTKVAIDAERLQLGAFASGTLGQGQSVYYRIDVAPGETLQFNFDSVSTTAANEVYVRYGAMPTRSEFDLSFSNAFSSDQQIVVPATQGGTYYVLAYGSSVVGDPAEYSLQANALDLSILRLGTTRGSNLGQTTMMISGAKFSTDAEVNLIAPDGSQRTASRVWWKDSTELWATFDLRGLNPEQYDVQVKDDGKTAILADSFTVNTGAPGKVETQIVAPKALRLGQNGIITVEYVNTGETDVLAPLISLTAENAELLPPGSGASTSSIEFLAINTDGPAGILSPGASGSISFVFAPTVTTGSVNFDLQVQSESDRLFDWATVKEEARPDFVPERFWDAFWNNFTASVGSTVSDYLGVLADNATHLSQMGEYTHSAARLLKFELQQAGNAFTNPAIAAVDIVDATPGLSLQFGRIFLQSLAGRYSLGSLGYGWTTPWEVFLSTDSTGNVASINGGGKQRFFFHQGNGMYAGYGDDKATLIWKQEGYRLQEIDGTVSAFRVNGKLDYTQDANGNRITAGYTGEQLTSLLHSNGDSLTLSYNPQGRISQITDSTGQIATYAYDTAGERLLSVRTHSGTVTYTYETSSHLARENALLSIAYPDNTHRYFEYDTQGRLARTYGDVGAETVSYTYDSAGSITITNADSSTTKTLLNDFGQVSQIHDALGNGTQFFYNDNGNLTSLLTPNGFTYAYRYDDQGNLTSQIDPLSHEVNFDYDSALNRLLSIEDQRGNTISYSYDSRGNQTGITYADGSTKEFNYDATGNLTQSINRREIPINYTYNNDGLLTRKDFANGTFAEYTYDNRGNLKSATESQGTTTMVYDAQNRLKQITYPSGRFLQFTYDAAGRRTQTVNQDGFTVNYTYDNVGRLAGLTDGNNNRIISYTYDNVGRLSREDNGNGTYTTYTYNNTQQIKELVNYAPDGSVNSRLSYTYNALGQKTSMTTLDGMWTYGYDAVGQLTSATFASTNPATPSQNLTYVYDAAGNRIRTIENNVTTDYTTNNLNQYTNATGVSYVYDADGNLFSRTENEQISTFTYDDQNRLLQLDTPDGSWRYEYDVFGNRVATIHNGQRTEYLIDPTGMGNVVGEYDSNGNLIANYVHGLGLASRTDVNNLSTYYDFDALGSTMGLTGSGGNYLNTYNYLPFGENLTSIETVANPFEYVGQWGVMDEENDLHFMRARYYLPSEGRFLNPDPIEVAGGLNLYAYTANNPTNWIDANGLAYTAISVSGPELTVAGVVGTQGQGRFIGETKFGGDLAVGVTSSVEDIQPGDYFRIQVSAAFGTAIFNWSKKSKNIETVEGGLGAVFNLQGSIPLPGMVGFNISEGTYILTGPPLPPITEPVQTPSSDSPPQTEPTNEPPAAPAFEWPELPDWIPPIFRWPFNNPLNQPVRWFVDIVSSFDPNDILGPQGFGAEHWVTAKDPLNYTIRFENDPIFATAPAQVVRITQQLDSDLDFRTFRVGDFGFADTFIDVPDNRAFYQTRLDLTATKGIYVDVVAGIDVATGQAFWELTSIDPTTGVQPTNPLQGFLPPNITKPEGDGFVSYSVKAKSSIENGAVIDAQARIIFDINEPIDTPAIFNTIDKSKPTSTVSALPSATNDTSFSVSWSGSDNTGGSALAGFTIYVSDNGGAFVPWLENTTLTEATFTGIAGHSYAFYSRAQDNAGNIEDAPSSPQASTTVASGNPGTLAFSAAEFSFSEDGTPIHAVTIIRTDGTAGSISATVTLSDDTAISPIDYNNTPIVVTFASGETSKTVLIPIVNDTLIESSQKLNLVLSNPTGGATIGGQNSASVTIVDDDVHLAFSAATFSAIEDGTQEAAVTVIRTGKISGAVGATITLSNGTATSPTDYDSTSIVVNFADGETTKTIVIPIVNDTVSESDEAIYLTLTNPTLGGTIGSQSTATFIIKDNDTPLNLIGTANNDTLVGAYGNDTLDGKEGSDTLIGGAGNDTLIGGTGSDTLDGGIGNDFMDGGVGNDTYIVDSVTDTIIENPGGGADTVQASVDFSIDGISIDDLILTGNAISGTGNSLNNRITGNAQNNILNGGSGYGGDTLDGGAGDDTMSGGLGHDTYIVDSPNDIIVENAAEGEDKVEASVDYSIAELTNVEHLILTGNAVKGTGNSQNNYLDGNALNNILSGGEGNDSLIGNEGDDTLIGGGGNDSLYGYTGNDTLDGGTGDDRMFGGTGNDTYIVDSVSDTITENLYEGDDTVQVSFDYSLAGLTNVEHLILTLNAINGTGNNQSNRITGNDLDNVLNGGAGYDTLIGGAGNDTLIGGTSDDTYVVDSLNDTVVENANEGYDSIEASIDYSIAGLVNIERLTLTGNAINGTGNSLSNRIIGNSQDNTLIGDAGNDTLDGSTGNDILIGGTGDDIYIVDSLNDTIVENANEGYDRIDASVSFSIAGLSNIEQLILTLNAINGTGNAQNNYLEGNALDNVLDGGEGDDNIWGNLGNDTLIGGAGNDTLSAYEGNDTLVGGNGNDVYYVNTTAHTIIEELNAGIDSVWSFVNWTLGENLENLTLYGSNSINGTGNQLSNTITGNAANNILSGGLSYDYLYGEAGDDTLYGEEGSDSLNGGDGNDTLDGGAGGDNLYGDAGNDILNGGSGSDNLRGNEGNDTLNGGSGNDSLDGGLGNDVLAGDDGDDYYSVESTSDSILEAANAGTDTVSASVSWTLGDHLENLTLTGTSIIAGIGNALNNTIRSNNYGNNLFGNDGNDTLIGGTGNDTLDGGTGNDRMEGSTGDDTYIVNSTTDTIIENVGSGTDTVIASIDYSIAGLTNIENLTLVGSAISGTGNSLNNRITGNALDNTLNGDSGNDTLIGDAGNDSLIGGTGNDTLDGGTGNDTMDGGSGDDTYIVDNTNGTIIENASSGTDTVIASIDYSIAGLLNVENLTLTGSATGATGNSLSNYITGNALDNTLNGGAGNDTLIGGNGNDTLDGGTGNDRMEGGAGDDIYIVDSTTDIAVENASSGTDTVEASVSFSISGFTYVENLRLTGSASSGTGNSLNNVITGNALNNTLNGGSGDDILIGGAADDTLVGGVGNDTYVIDSLNDSITEYSLEGTDTVEAAIDFSIASLTYVENLTLTGNATNGTGNSVNNRITGNAQNNTLNGGAGDDTLIGGAGDDTLVGGVGNDTYNIDSLNDTITENASEGTDTVEATIDFSIATLTNIEDLTLTGNAIKGTGNLLNNRITGNALDNILDGGALNDTLIGGAGNDTLIGGTGNDAMDGGTGDDTYIVDTTSDIIIENASSGTDTIEASVSFSISGLSNIENLTLTGSATSGTGNSLNNVITGNALNNTLNGGAGNDTLSGGAGNDTLDGSTGNDVLFGGDGDDTYTVDSTSDSILEAANAGTDTVNSSISWTLGDNLEKLTLTGSSIIDGIGNALNNTIAANSVSNNLFGHDGNDNLTGGVGNDLLDGGTGEDTLIGGSGNDTLIGGFGNDVLTGSTGADIFVLNNPNSGVDSISDFSAVDDTLSVSAAGFGGGLTVGSAITSSQFLMGSSAVSATNSSQRFIYNTTTGALFFDADGNQTGFGAVQVTTLSNKPTIGTSDIFVTA